MASRLSGASSKKPPAIPAYSQFLDVKNKRWQDRACGVVALKMLIDHRAGGGLTTTPTIEGLIRRRAEFHAHLPGTGWSHAGLAALATAYGFTAKNYDWAELPRAEAEQKLSRLLKHGPVVVSIYRNLQPKASGHLALLIDLTKDRARYHDPDSKTRSGIIKTCSRRKFLNGWKHRAIAVNKPNLYKK